MPLNFKKRLKGHFLQQKGLSSSFCCLTKPQQYNACRVITTASRDLSTWFRETQPCHCALLPSPRHTARKPLGIFSFVSFLWNLSLNSESRLICLYSRYVKALSLGAAADGGLAEFLCTQRTDFLQGADHCRGNAVRGLSAPSFQDLGYFCWIAGTQVTKRIHGC